MPMEEMPIEGSDAKTRKEGWKQCQRKDGRMEGIPMEGRNKGRKEGRKLCKQIQLAALLPLTDTESGEGEGEAAHMGVKQSKSRGTKGVQEY